MTGWELFGSAWDWEPSVLAGCAALAIAYCAMVRRRMSRAGYFLGGLCVLLFALVSPIDRLGDEYLFSVHVVQHLLLGLIVPLLLLLGTPEWLARQALRRPLILGAERVLGRVAVAWPAGVGTMLAWHVPVWFNAALAREALHVFQHLTFLVGGTIFWWPVLGPLKERRLAPWAAIFYLFSSCTTCSLLGAAITFGPAGLYPAYLQPEDRLGILRLIRVGWGLDAKGDQQLGGMLMWVPGCLIYLSAILATVARWYGTGESSAGESA